MRSKPSLVFSRLPAFAALIVAFGLLSACQTGPGGKIEPGVTPNAVAGDAIEVTALDAVPGEDAAPAEATGPEPVGTEKAAQQASPAGEDAALAEAEPATAADAVPAPKPDLAEVPPTPKSERQLACEKRNGKWVKIGKGEVRACVYPTRDSGKRCERESQCDGVCLARSGTCSPYKPMFGCNEILQDDGMRVTLCLD